MWRFLFKRGIQALLVIILVLSGTFVMLRISGDPGSTLLPADATPQEREALRESLGLNDPLPVQFWRYFERALRGDFGDSIRYKYPSLSLVLERLPATLQLVGFSMVLALLVGVPLGVFASVRRGTFLDALATNGALLGLAIPHFWFAIVLIIVFGVTLGWLPTSGRGSPLNLVLPVTSLAVSFLPEIVLLVRTEMIDGFNQPYIQTARAKGLSRRRIRYRHNLRNALIPLVTVVGLNAGVYLGSAVITEAIFAWPGVGQLALQGVAARDFPLVQATVVVLAVAIILINYTVDILYTVLDPRIRAE